MKIHDYGYKPQYKKVPKNVRLFGVELEITHKPTLEGDWSDFDDEEEEELEEIAGKIGKHFKGGAVFKWDGSVDSGWEIVTRPFTLQEQREFWHEEKFKMLDKKGFISYTAPHNGMHVHVSRFGLTQLQIAKVIRFIHNPDNRPFIKKIAQREEKQYAEFSQKKNFNCLKNHQYRKYTAVNLIPQNTIEFRLFKGTLSFAAFHKNLEFVDAILNFCAAANSGVKESEVWWNFVYFVSSRRKEYPFLWEYCQHKEMDSVDSWKKHVEERKARKEAEKAAKKKQNEDLTEVEDEEVEAESF